MASSSSSSKQLWELLHEQQEPFTLDTYLSERRMMLKNRKPSRYNMDKRIFRTKKILKLVLYRFFRPKSRHQDLNCCIAQKHGLASKTKDKLQQIGASKRHFCLGSSVAYVDSSKCKDSPCYENQASPFARTSNKYGSIIKQEVGTNSKEDEKQLNSTSLPNEDASSNLGCQFFGQDEGDDASTSSTILIKSAEEDSILSSFLWELLAKTLLEKQNQAGLMEEKKTNGPGFSKLLKDKTALQQTKQLLFDCINEAIEIHRTTSRNQKCTQEFFGLQELGRIIYDQICSWGNQNSAQKADFDVSSIDEGWDDLKQLHRKIGKEIGDAIINEMIHEVIGLFLQ